MLANDKPSLPHRQLRSIFQVPQNERRESNRSNCKVDYKRESYTAVGQSRPNRKKKKILVPIIEENLLKKTSIHINKKYRRTERSPTITEGKSIIILSSQIKGCVIQIIDPVTN